MALFKGTIVGPASGKLNGMVFSHNAGGQYMRKLSIPVNTNTSQQQVVRNAVKTLSGRWSQVLTTAQRDAWSTYGLAVGSVNRLGDTVKLSGLAAYVQCNTPRIQAGLSVVDAGPTTTTKPTATSPNGTLTANSTLLSVTFATTDGWANESGGALLIYTSRLQTGATNFFAGPYRLSGKILGNATPPTSPANVTMAFPSGPTGTKIFLQARASRADGRLSAPFLVGLTV